MCRVLVATASRSRGLADDEIAALATAASNGTRRAPRRLGPNGAEVPIAPNVRLDARLPAVAGVDINILPAENRRKKLLIADMDSTMIPVECIDEMAAVAGVGPEVAAITDRAMRGELDFVKAMKARVALVKDLPVAALEQICNQRINLNLGGRALVRTMAAHGAHTALVSGGFSFFTERVAQAAGFAEQRANRLGVVDGRLDGTISPPILGRRSKRDTLRELTAKLGLALDDAVALGDGANDLDMITAAGLGVGYRPKPVLAEAADVVLRHSDLDAVLYLQGYSAEEVTLD